MGDKNDTDASKRHTFAPLDVPLKRRLQTAAVLFHTCSIAGTVCLFFALCSLPALWPLCIAYTVLSLQDKSSFNGTLSRRSDFMRRLNLFIYLRDYFPMTLQKTVPLDPNVPYIFGFHPHGIISISAFLNFATEATGFSNQFPGIRNSLLTISSNFKLPFYRDYLLSLGVASVSKRSCSNLLRNGHSITIVVGGAQGNRPFYAIVRNSSSRVAASQTQGH